MAGASALDPQLRTDLESVIRRLADAGKIPTSGERELLLRITPAGTLRWYQPTAVRVAASELDRGFDETAAGL